MVVVCIIIEYKMVNDKMSSSTVWGGLEMMGR